MNNNIVKHQFRIGDTDHKKLKGHSGMVLWFTGLSGSGKSTIANQLQQLLHEKKMHTYTLDGDNIRHGLNKDLSFNPEDRTENIRRIAEVANLFANAGIITIVSFIAPYEKDRMHAAEIIGTQRFHEIYINCPLEECEKRDPKGLYKKARNNEIKDFTGIDAPYEAPKNPAITINSNQETPESAAQKIYDYLVSCE